MKLLRIKNKAAVKISCQLILVILLLMSHDTLAQCPWNTVQGETKIEGEYLGASAGCIAVKTAAGVEMHPLAAEPIIAVMGSQTGQLIPLSQMPSGQKVELYLDSGGKVRALRNKIIEYSLPKGTDLGVWGHDALLSPAGDYYLLYNYHHGLTLYSIKEPALSLVLSSLPQAAWNSEGKKLAYASEEGILVADLSQEVNHTFNIDTIYPFKTKENDLVSILTGLDWQPAGDKILLTILADGPDRGSSVFRICVITEKGGTLAAETIENLESAIWLAGDSILVTCCSYDYDANGLKASGHGYIWNYRTGGKTPFLPNISGYYHDLDYNQENGVLAYALRRGISDTLYLARPREKIIYKLVSSPFPLCNIQWSSTQDLYGWDEYNNIICRITTTTGPHQDRISPVLEGYLPRKAAGKNLIYFPAEPFAEPLSLHFFEP